MLRNLSIKVVLTSISLFVFLFLASGAQAKDNDTKKIALVFLTRNGVNHPDLWKTHLAGHADKYNFYIYSDTPLDDPFFESRRIKQLIPTKWDYHIKTWQLLLTEAFKDPENYKFVYLSESCVPLHPLEDIYAMLTKNDGSYMCFAGPWWPRNNPREVVGLPIEHRWGNHEWVILNRRHAEMVVNDFEIIEIVSKYWIDSESYPSTLFSVKKCLNEFICRPSTYVNWAITENNGAHPYHFREVNPFNWLMLLEAKKARPFLRSEVYKKLSFNRHFSNDDYTNPTIIGKYV